MDRLSQTHEMAARAALGNHGEFGAPRRLFEDAFPSGSYGNVLSSITFLAGLALDELSPGELEYTEPVYRLIVPVVAYKAEATSAGR
jgi:hypothetical protein